MPKRWIPGITKEPAARKAMREAIKRRRERVEKIEKAIGLLPKVIPTAYQDPEYGRAAQTWYERAYKLAQKFFPDIAHVMESGVDTPSILRGLGRKPSKNSVENSLMLILWMRAAYIDEIKDNPYANH